MIAPCANASTLEAFCQFEVSATQDSIEKISPFTLHFAYDNVSRKGFVTGNNGAEEVVTFSGTEGITFIEVLPTGAVQSTTASWNGDAVHSRHTMMRMLLPSQNYGQCTFDEK